MTKVHAISDISGIWKSSRLLYNYYYDNFRLNDYTSEHRSALSFGWKTGLARLGLNMRGAASSFRSLSPDLLRPSPLPRLLLLGSFFLRSPAISNWATQFPSFASREKFPDCASVAAARLLNRWQHSMLRQSQQQTRAMQHNNRVLLWETVIF